MWLSFENASPNRLPLKFVRGGFFMERETANGRRTDFVRTLLLGVIFCAVFLLLLLGLAFLYSCELLGQGREGVYARVCLLLSVLVCSGIAGSRVRSGKLLFSLLSVSVFVIFLLFSGVFTKNAAIFNMSLLTDLLIIISGGFVGAFLSARGKKRKKRN